MNNFHRFQNFRQFSNLFSQIRLKKRHTSLFSGICREIRTKFHQKFAEKMQNLTQKNCKLYFHRIAQKLCKPASRAAGGSSLASESCTIRKSWKKIQLPFITCNSANYERHFHNNGQAHTLILNLPFTGKCQRRFDPSNGPANFLPMQRRRHVNVLRIKVNKSVLLSCHGKFAENTLENMNATYSCPDTCSDVGYLISTSRW